LRRGVLDIVRDYTATFGPPDYGPIYTAEAKLREDSGIVCFVRAGVHRQLFNAGA